MTVPSKGAFLRADCRPTVGRRVGRRVGGIGFLTFTHLANNNIEMIVFTVLLVFLPTGQSTASPQELEIAIGGYETAAWSTTESI